ncbi:patatin-like phospholipase family protein [Dickeya oryzae]
MNNSQTKLKKGLSLSGGGFRATLYSLGSLIRLNETGLMRELDTITSVSGGSISSAWLMLNWNKLNFKRNADNPDLFIAENFNDIITKPLLEFCSRYIVGRKEIFLSKIFPCYSAVNSVKSKYSKYLFGDVLLKHIELSHGAPEFIFYGTNLDTGSSVRIQKESVRDYNIGIAYGHTLSLAQAISISSGFPPFLSPIVIDSSDWDWNSSGYEKLPNNVLDRLRQRLILCDGGLYDNMGLEALWKTGNEQEFGTVFCCDAGAPMSMPWTRKDLKYYSWYKQFNRMTDIMINQQRALRKRTLMNNLVNGEYKGGYWGIDIRLTDSDRQQFLLEKEFDQQYSHIKFLETQLKPFSDSDMRKLINLGYCHSDLVLRQRYCNSIPTPTSIPFPL